MNNYYQFINNIIGDENINNEINIQDYIFEKLISFIKKYNYVFNNEINWDKLKIIYKNNKLDIYNIIIYLWNDIIHDDADDEELYLLYNKINGSLIKESNIIKKETELNSKEDNSNFIDKMLNNLKLNNKIENKNENINNTFNIDSLNSSLNKYLINNKLNNENDYYYMDIDVVENNTIKIKNKFLQWDNNSCLFDSFLFLFV